MRGTNDGVIGKAHLHGGISDVAAPPYFAQGGWTALIIAVWTVKRLDLVQALLRGGANTETTDKVSGANHLRG